MLFRSENALRSAGHVALPMVEVYPDGTDQAVADPEWIAMVSAKGWIALTKDLSIVRDHPDALAASTLRVFALNNANLTGVQMAQRYVDNLPTIARRAGAVGPYVFAVTAGGLERRWPK